jgi:hypothetical protein
MSLDIAGPIRTTTRREFCPLSAAPYWSADPETSTVPGTETTSTGGIVYNNQLSDAEHRCRRATRYLEETVDVTLLYYDSSAGQVPDWVPHPFPCPCSSRSRS